MTASSKKDGDKTTKSPLDPTQLALQKLKNDAMEEALRYLNLSERSAKKSTAQTATTATTSTAAADNKMTGQVAIPLTAKRASAEALIKTLGNLDLRDQNAAKILQDAINLFHQQTEAQKPNTFFYKLLAIKNMPTLVERFLTRKEAAGVATTSRFFARRMQEPLITVRRQKEFRDKLREPILQGVQEKRWRYSYPPDLEAEQKEVDEVLKAFEQQCSHIDYQRIYERYRKLALIKIWTLGEIQLILLSDDNDRITRWVKNNEDNLREPIDNLGLCPLHYLAFNNQVAIFRDLQKNKKFNFETLQDNYEFPLFHLAALGGAIEAVRFFNEGLLNFSIITLAKNGANIDDAAALGGNIKMLELCLSSSSGKLVGKFKAKWNNSYRNKLIMNAIYSGQIEMMRYCGKTLGYNMATTWPWLGFNCSIDLIKTYIKEFKCAPLETTQNKRSFLSNAAKGPFETISKLNYAKDQLKLDLHNTRDLDDDLTIVKYISAMGRASALAYCIDDLKMDPIPRVRPFNEIGAIAASKDNYEVFRFCVIRNIMPPDIYTPALLGRSRLIPLTCRLLGLNTQLFDLRYSNKLSFEGALLEKFTSCFNDADFNAKAKHYITEWGKIESDAKKDIFDKCVSLLDYYLKNSKAEYATEAKLFQKRIQQLKNQHPVELFLCLNNRILDLIVDHYKEKKLAPPPPYHEVWTNPFVLCVLVMTHKILQHTLELRKNLLAKEEQGSSFKKIIFPKP